MQRIRLTLLRGIPGARTMRAGVLVAGAALSIGCFQMTTVLKVNGSGGGTIDHQLVITKAALAQIRQFAALAGGQGQRLDLVSEDQARAMAAELGPGVTYVSSVPIDSPEGQGRATTYAFTDVSQIRISQQPQPPGGMTISAQGLPGNGATVTCSLTRNENGNAVLHINLPELNLPPGATDPSASGPPIAQQLAMVRSLLAGARVLIAVEPAGQLVRTSSPYVDGQRVTLVDVNLDQLLGNEALLTGLQGAKGPEEIKAAIKAALNAMPDVKLTLDREVTVEFMPER